MPVSVSASRKRGTVLYALLWISYFIGYLMRYDYGASISEIISAEGITKSQAGLVSTSLFITYAIGQLVSGFLGDKIKPYHLIIGGLLTSSVCNFAMPLAEGFGWMLLLWGINGFAQALLWPPMVRIIAENFTPDDTKKKLVNISFACALSTISVYLLAPLCIRISGWKSLFFFTGGCGIVITLINYFLFPKLFSDSKSKETASESGKPIVSDEKLGRLFYLSGAFFMMFAIVCQGAIRDGVTTWVPKMLSELFHVDNANSILVTVLLPVLTMVSLKLTEFLNRSVFKNEVKCASFLFALALVCFIVLALGGKNNMIVTLVLSGISVACIHGVNLMLIMQVPSYFGKYGRISTVSGVLNTFTYVGSSASTYGFGLLIDLWGWDTLIITWIVIAGAGLAASVLALKKWTAFR